MDRRKVIANRIARTKTKKYICVMLVCMLVLTGCSQNVPGTTQTMKEEKNTMEVVTFSDATTDSIVQEPTTAEETQEEELDYTSIVNDLKQMEPDYIPDHYLNLANTFLNTKILNEDKEIVVGKLSGREKDLLDYSLIENAVFGTYEGFGYRLSRTDEMDNYFQKEDVKELLEDFYGYSHENMTWTRGSYKEIDETKVEVMFADGDPVVLTTSGDFRENENYCLLSVPCFYVDNSEAPDQFEYYADILFQKNKDSCFGMNLVYANAYEEKKVVKEVIVSSALENYGDKTYGGANLIDNDYTTAWVEGVEGVGDMETITLKLEPGTRVHGIIVYNGYQASKESYFANGKPLFLFVDYGDGCNITNTLEPVPKEMEPYLVDGEPISVEWFSLGFSYATDEIQIRIMGAEAGEKYEDTCISEIVVY